MTKIQIEVCGANVRVVGKEGLLTTGMVGAVVVFRFDGAWEGLRKTAVFRCGGVVRDVLEVEREAVIPWEVLAAPGTLYIGVEGRAGDGSVVIPTVWALTTVCEGANASGDPSTDPSLPVWAQLQEQIEALKNGGGSGGDLSELEAAVAQIKDYMYSAEKVARYVTGQEVSVAVDTAAGTVTVSEGYLFYRDQRIPVAQASVALLEKAVSVHNVIVYDTTAKAVRCVPIKQFDGTSMFIIAILWDGKLTDPSANWIPGKWSVDGAVYPQTAGASAVPEKVYVSTSGSDSNSGENGKPFKTLGKAIASGAKTVIVAPGTYRETVSTGRPGGELEIIGKPTSLTEKDVVIELGTELAMAADDATGLVKAQRAGSEADFLYRAFVSGTERLFYDDSFITDGHSCDLWLGDRKLVPVATLAECQATEGTWTYDGSCVYANGAEGGYMLADGEHPYGIYLGYFKKVKLSGIVVRHAREDAVRLKGCTDAEISRCVFSHSSLYNGLALEYTSATVRDCEAAWNRTDGFNIHGVATADFIGCVSHDNGDDGISHHDRSGGMVIGGEYYANGKGGVCSPTFGSRNGVNGADIHHNGVGVYAVADGDVVACPDSYVSNCVIRDNGVGIKTQYYKLKCWGNVLEGNDTDVVEENGGIVKIVRDSIPAPATAQVGQTIVVKEVDGDGKPVSWECADVAVGTAKETTTLADFTLEEDVTDFDVLLNDDPFTYSMLLITITARCQEGKSGQWRGYLYGGTKSSACIHLNAIISNATTTTVSIRADLFNTRVYVTAHKAVNYLWNTTNKYSYEYGISDRNANSENKLRFIDASVTAGATVHVEGVR